MAFLTLFHIISPDFSFLRLLYCLVLVMNLVPQGIVGSVGGGLIWAITDLGPARGHVRIGSHTSKREQCVLKKRREKKNSPVLLPPLSHTFTLLSR